MNDKNNYELFEILDNLCRMLDDKECKELINIKFEELIKTFKMRCMTNKIMLIALSSILGISIIYSIYKGFFIKTLLLNLFSILVMPILINGVNEDKIMLKQVKFQYEKFKSIY